MSAYNFGVRWCSPTKLFSLDVFLGWRVKANTILGGTVFRLKFGRAKNVQNLVRFTKTFEFDRKYLWTV